MTWFGPAMKSERSRIFEVFNLLGRIGLVGLRDGEICLLQEEKPEVDQLVSDFGYEVKGQASILADESWNTSTHRTESPALLGEMFGLHCRRGEKRRLDLRMAARRNVRLMTVIDVE